MRVGVVGACIGLGPLKLFLLQILFLRLLFLGGILGDQQLVRVLKDGEVFEPWRELGSIHFTRFKGSFELLMLLLIEHLTAIAPAAGGRLTGDEAIGEDLDDLVDPLLLRHRLQEIRLRPAQTIQEENGQSRIYLGIHWSFDKTEGIAQGRRVGDYVFDHAFTPTHP